MNHLAYKYGVLLMCYELIGARFCHQVAALVKIYRDVHNPVIFERRDKIMAYLESVEILNFKVLL
jgi:hypothetical protein